MANCLGDEKCELGIAMDGHNEKEFASPVSLARLKVGDLVHVFEGTGAGLVNGRDVGWFGKVVGMEGETYLVRNRLLNGRGPANRVLGQFLKLQKVFGFQMSVKKGCTFGPYQNERERDCYRAVMSLTIMQRKKQKGN